MDSVPSQPAIASAAAPPFYSPVVWLSLVCLDAPLVAVGWQWLFARSFGARLSFSLRVLLFLTAWLIYLADRFADTIRLPASAPISLRHQFCREHTIGWWLAIVVIFVVDTSLALRALDLQMLLLGGTLAALCAVYLVVNHSLGGKWPALPMKEKAIGVLFAAGTSLAVIAELPGLTIAFGCALVVFAALCTFNCLCIASWERELDLGQGKSSLLTRWPAAARVFKSVGLAIASAALICALIWRFGWGLWLCLTASALLLIWLNARPHIARDNRTALADLVLLTPLLLLLLLLLIGRP